jgi:putative aldouronate transport system permease protein
MAASHTQAPRPSPQEEAAVPPPHPEPVPGAVRRRSTWQSIKRDRTRLIMVSPMVVLVAVFAYVPIAGNVIAFKDYSPFVGIRDSPWVGFSNFERVFADPTFWNAVQNTLVITLFTLVFYFPATIALALLMNSVLSAKVRLALQSVVYLPHFFSWVLVVSIFQLMLGGAGLVSQLLIDHGHQGLDIMTNGSTFVLLVTSQAIWKDAGWGMIVFLAALAAVNVSLYEAAALDGAGRWRRLWHVTLPAIRPVIVLLLVLRLGDALTVGFEQMFLQRDAVGADASEVLDTFVYYTGVQYGDWSFAAAAGLVKGMVSVGLVLLANRVAHAFGEEGVFARA